MIIYYEKEIVENRNFDSIVINDFKNLKEKNNILNVLFFS